jgi:hypothetical protein
MSPKNLYRQSLLIVLLTFAVAFLLWEDRGTRQSHEASHGGSSQRKGVPEAADASSHLPLLEADSPGAAHPDQPGSSQSHDERLALLKKQLVEEQGRLDIARQNIFDLQNVLDVPEEAAGWDTDQALLKPRLKKYAEYFKARKVYEQCERNRRELYLKILSESRDARSGVGGSFSP